MICMSRLSERNADAPSSVTLRPSNQISPPVGSIRRRMQRPVVDLPEPNSPTSPSVSPGCDVEAHSVDRVNHCGIARQEAAADLEVLGQVLDAQKRLAHAAISG